MSKYQEHEGCHGFMDFTEEIYMRILMKSRPYVRRHLFGAAAVPLSEVMNYFKETGDKRNEKLI